MSDKIEIKPIPVSNIGNEPPSWDGVEEYLFIEGIMPTVLMTRAEFEAKYSSVLPKK